MLMNFKPMVYHWQEARWLPLLHTPAAGDLGGVAKPCPLPSSSQSAAHLPAPLLLTPDVATQMPNGNLPQALE